MKYGCNKVLVMMAYFLSLVKQRLKDIRKKYSCRFMLLQVSCTPKIDYIKVGCKGVFATWTYKHDGIGGLS